MADAIISGLFEQLVERMGGPTRQGGQGVLANLLEARTGKADMRGTVSKMCSGHLEISYEAILVAENFTGSYPISTRRGEEIVRRGRQSALSSADIPELAATCAIRAGAAQAELFRALSDISDGGAALTPNEAAAVVAEMRAVQETVGQIIALAEEVAQQPQASSLRSGRAGA
ncbi:hypothetical protein [Pseudoroseicyclus aestuarii]|uniref:Uncharacterized protein n=1 Tax=Pseudoroseicyclus aestuarii TaxID=1795041 RepID=A0A318SSF0_9RHOB|nr:hypothetical protein [Pseudoroseicyclus aestuarii]PYE81306.1 hypothetical protein DFP88_10797 [Pseudoroseicyclus aestuarii]